MSDSASLASASLVGKRPLQMTLDLVIITGVVYATGSQDSDFISLYLLAILMGSIFFSGRGAFLVAGGSFVLLASVVELSYYGIIPRTAISLPAPRTLESWLAINLFAFLAVAYLASLLAHTIRRKGVELEEKQEELKDLQAFNQNIIESMRGGLLTTDLDGRILLLNRAGAEITGLGSGLARRERPGLFPGILARGNGRERQSPGAAEGDRISCSRWPNCVFWAFPSRSCAPEIKPAASFSIFRISRS